MSDQLAIAAAREYAHDNIADPEVENYGPGFVRVMLQQAWMAGYARATDDARVRLEGVVRARDREPGGEA